MRMTVGTGRRAFRLGATMALLLASSGALAQSRLGADINVNAGVSSNPFGADASNSASGTLTGSFSPTYSILSPTGAVNLGGSITHTEYSRLYKGTTDYGVNGSTRQQLSPTMSFNAAVGYSSRIRNALFPVVDPIGGPIANPDDPIIVDPSATVSFAERTQIITGSTGLGITLSPRDSVNVSARGTRVTFPTPSLNRAYDSYGGGLSYSRLISQNSSIGLSMDVSRSDYRTSNLGNGTQYAPSLLFSTKFSPRLSFNASAGVTFSETETLFGKLSNTSFSGSVGLCHAGERSQFCVNGSRRVLPSSFSGNSTVTALGASYRYTIDQRSSIGANISYSRAQSLAGTGALDSDYGQAGLNYQRQILQRLSVVVSASYSDSYESTVTRDPNFYGSVGVRYRLGDL